MILLLAGVAERSVWGRIAFCGVGYEKGGVVVCRQTASGCGGVLHEALEAEVGGGETAVGEGGDDAVVAVVGGLEVNGGEEGALRDFDEAEGGLEAGVVELSEEVGLCGGEGEAVCGFVLAGGEEAGGGEGVVPAEGGDAGGGCGGAPAKDHVAA